MKAVVTAVVIGVVGISVGHAGRHGKSVLTPILENHDKIQLGKRTYLKYSTAGTRIVDEVADHILKNLPTLPVAKTEQKHHVYHIDLNATVVRGESGPAAFSAKNKTRSVIGLGDPDAPTAYLAMFWNGKNINWKVFRWSDSNHKKFFDATTVFDRKVGEPKFNHSEELIDVELRELEMGDPGIEIALGTSREMIRKGVHASSSYIASLGSIPMISHVALSVLNHMAGAVKASPYAAYGTSTPFENSANRANIDVRIGHHGKRHITQTYGSQGLFLTLEQWGFGYQGDLYNRKKVHVNPVGNLEIEEEYGKEHSKDLEIVTTLNAVENRDKLVEVRRSSSKWVTVPVTRTERGVFAFLSQLGLR